MSRSKRPRTRSIRNAPKKINKVNKIIILKKKKTKKAPANYSDRAEWLRKKAGQDLGFKNKKKFTPAQKAKITRLFKGEKHINEDTGQEYHAGGLYQWRDAHRSTIKSPKQRAALERQHVKIVGDVAYIPRRQKGEKVTINSDGSRTRYIGAFKQKTYPLTIEQIRDMLDDPESAAEWLEALAGPGNTYRLEYTNGFGGQEETIHDLLNAMQGSKGFKQAGVLEKIVGVMVETRILQRGKKTKAKGKKGAKGRGN